MALELAGAVLYTIRFAFDMPFGKAIYHGVFHAISIFNNAGFDLSGDFSSFSKYASDIYMNFVSMLLIIFGGFGFIVLADLFEIRKKKKFSLHTKVVLSVSAALIVIGALIILIFEFTNSRTFGEEGFGQKMLSSLFHSVTTRSGGVTTVNVADFRQATQFFIIILMFIGASRALPGRH